MSCKSGDTPKPGGMYSHGVGFVGRILESLKAMVAGAPAFAQDRDQDRLSDRKCQVKMEKAMQRMLALVLVMFLFRGALGQEATPTQADSLGPGDHSCSLMMGGVG